MDYGNFTVKVPKEDLSFMFAATSECTDCFGTEIITATGTMSLNDDGLLTITVSDGRTLTTLLNGNIFSVTDAVLIDPGNGVTLTWVVEGTVNIDYVNREMTGYGTDTTTSTDNHLTCNSTWASN